MKFFANNIDKKFMTIKNKHIFYVRIVRNAHVIKKNSLKKSNLLIKSNFNVIFSSNSLMIIFDFFVFVAFLAMRAFRIVKNTIRAFFDQQKAII